MISLRTRTPRFGFALLALFAVVTLIAALAYTISAWQVFGFARHVWHMPLPLSFAAAFVADLLSLSGLFATYVLREAKWHVRLYAWIVFGGMTGLSIAAAESFAEWRNVSAAAQLASGAIVVALALAVHLLIVAVRHSRREPLPEQPAKPAADPVVKAERRIATAVERAAGAAPVTQRPARPATPPAAPPVSSGKGGGRGRQVDPVQQEQHDKVAYRVVTDQVSTKEAAREQGVSTRTIQNWVASYNDRRHLTPPVMPELTGPDDEPAEIGKPQLTEEVNV